MVNPVWRWTIDAAERLVGLIFGAAFIASATSFAYAAVAVADVLGSLEWWAALLFGGSE